MKFLDIKLAAEEELIELSGNTDRDKRLALYRLSGGPAYCGYYDGRLVGAAGLHLLKPGYAEAWALIDRRFEKLPTNGRIPTAESMGYLEMVIWSFKEMIYILRRRFDIKRIRAISVRGISGSQRFLKACGFKRLCEGRKYFIFEYGE